MLIGRWLIVSVGGSLFVCMDGCGLLVFDHRWRWGGRTGFYLSVASFGCTASCAGFRETGPRWLQSYRMRFKNELNGNEIGGGEIIKWLIHDADLNDGIIGSEQKGGDIIDDANDCSGGRGSFPVSDKSRRREGRALPSANTQIPSNVFQYLI